MAGLPLEPDYPLVTVATRASIVEVPISFTDREHGESKMSQAIVIEALWLVTKWAVERPFSKPDGAAKTVTTP